MSQRWFPALLALLSVAVVVSCSGGATPTVPVPTPRPTQAPVATAPPKPTTPPAVATAGPTTPPAAAPTAVAPTPTTVLPPTPASKAPFTRAQLDKIFPPGREQDLVFQACNNCHNWVPLLIAQLPVDSWYQNKVGHRERVSGVSDADYDLLYAYLAKNVNDKTPIPNNIPQELLDQWTSY
jgi:hypothetical protein